MAIERSVKETLHQQFLLNFGEHPTHLTQVALPFISLGQEHPDELGCFFSWSLNAYIYGSYRHEQTSSLRIHGTSFPRFHLDSHGFKSDMASTPSYSAFFTSLWFHALSAGYQPLGKSIFIDISTFVTQKWSSLIPIAILVLNVLGLNQTHMLTLEDKAMILSKAIKEGFHIHIRKDMLLAAMHGGISYGHGGDESQSFIEKLPSSLFEPYRLLSFYTHGGQYYQEVRKKEQSFARMMKDHFHVTRLSNIDPYTFHEGNEFLTTTFGTQAYHHVNQVIDFQKEGQHLFIQLEKGITTGWIPLLRKQLSSWFELHKQPEEMDKAYRLLHHLHHTLPNLSIYPLDGFYPSTLIAIIPKEKFLSVKESLSEFIYPKHLCELKLVNRSISTYIL
jgi:hypothetical protein